MDRFIPDMYVKSIFDIDYKALKKRGIKCILFDLDNTIAPLHIPIPDKEVKDLFSDLNLLKLKVIILSNASKSRVEPFKEKLNVDSSYRSYKPFKKKYKKIMDMYGFKDNEIACIGDQLLTDIYGANHLNLLSILVNPISHDDYWISKVNRFVEGKIYKILEKRGLFQIGKYYD